MRIAYSGWFLREGFEKLGCEVVPFRLDAGKTLDACVEDACHDPDCVFVELLGRTNLPQAIFKSRHRLAIYCIDSALNEYWLIPLARLCDAVYVDQLPSVEKFRTNGVPATWLPLCVAENDFRQPAEKTHLITFVGRTTEHRIKRNNLLAYLKNHFPINVVQDVPKATMLDIFASSRIVLNEDIFPGLNLRFFQALASGSLLLTERHGHGVGRHFQEGRHYVGYSPEDLVRTIGDMERSYERYAPIAARGQEACRRHHTSEHRARLVIEDLDTKASRADVPLPEKKLHEALAKYNHALRFGGTFTEAVALLKEAAQAPNGVATQALSILGGLSLRLGNTGSGAACLEKCLDDTTMPGLDAALKLMLLHANDERFPVYLSALAAKLPELGLQPAKYVTLLDGCKDSANRYYGCCMLGCALLFDLGRNFDIGFLKQQDERFPDYALEYAVLAFTTRKTAESLDGIISCAKKAGIAPEALAYIKSAILAVVASEEQIALAVSLAYAYYDFSFAGNVVKLLKKMVAP